MRKSNAYMGACWIWHDTTLARVQGGLESKVERYAPPVGGLERSRELRSGGGGGVRVWGVCWAMRSCSGSASVDARSKLLS